MVFTNLKSALALVSVVASASAVSVHAAETHQDENYFTLGSVETQVLDEQTGSVLQEQMAFLPAPEALPIDLGGIGSATEVIQVGKQVWDIVVANKPVVDASSERVSALPPGINDWRGMHGWKAPQSRTYRVAFKNLYGGTMIDFTYQVLFTPGGTLNGKGLYLSNMTILPANLFVAWGYTFRSRGSVPGIMNAGSAVSPMAAAQMQLTWSVDTVLAHHEGTSSFYVRADGTFQQL